MTKDEFNDAEFIDKMYRYTKSANDVPVDRVTIKTKDLLRLIEIALKQVFVENTITGDNNG